MALTATLYLDDSVAGDERRTATRRPIGRETTLRRAGKANDVVLHDLSSTGASIETSALLAPGATVTIGLPGVGRFAAEVISQTGARFGCRFAQPLTDEAVARAFSSDPIVVGPFTSPDLDTMALPTPEKYPGYVRVALPIGGALIGWTLAGYLLRVAFG